MLQNQNVKSNKAFTLIELMVALAIISISIAALMETSVVVMRNNLRNEIRNKAIAILSNHVDNLSNQSYDAINPGVFSISDNKTIRNFTESFAISDNITKDSSTNGKYITSKISWIYSGKTYDYTINTVVNKQ
jgi:prepilin-type N-terminal cleavage/methylation domain-containing protein